MATFNVYNSVIRGVAAAVPSTVRDNMEYDYIPLRDREMLVKTTGIRYRREAVKYQTTSDLCLAAAEKIISGLKINKEEIGILVFVSQSPDYWLPATAITLQHRLGLSKSTMAFDINLGCSGYVYGLSVVSSLQSTMKCKYALLMAGDISTFSPNKKDKSTYPIFGDGGTATLLEYAENGLMSFDLNSDGAGAESIIIPHGGIRHPFDDTSGIEAEVEPGVIRNKKNVALNGMDVFNFSVAEAPTTVNRLLQFTHSTIGDYDYFLFHQANKLMNETIRKKLGVPPEKTPYSLFNYGNTSSASIPLTMVTELNETMNTKTNRLILCGFGVGLSWGTCAVTVDKLYCPPVIEV